MVYEKKMWKKKISEHFSTDFTDADILPTRLILCRVFPMQKLSPQRQCLHRTSLHTTFIEPLNIYADIIPTSQNFTQKSLKVD